MHLEIKPALKVSQALALTPNIQLGLKLLAMNCFELEDALQKELIENPVLEGEFFDFPSGSLRFKTNQDLPEINQTYGQEVSLNQHLLWQVQVSNLNIVEREIAICLIGEIDERGFLSCDENVNANLNLAKIKRKQSTRERLDKERKNKRKHHFIVKRIAKELQLPKRWVENVRRRLLFYEPVGCFAQNIIECLLAQLVTLGFDNKTVEYQLVDKHLTDLKMHQFKKLLHRFHINEARLGNALKVLKKLTLFPSSHYFSLSEKNLQIIQPDVFLEKHQNVFFVFLNENERHQVKLNSYYLALLKSKTLPAVRSYIQEKIRLALCIKKALLFRKKTLLRVVEAIVDWQKNWFKAKGPLRPLTLREIADVIGAHESTVSRATNGKYLQTDQGVFELKYFFSSTLLTTEGEEISGEAIRGMIQMIVEQENFNEPLSDSTIQKKLLEKRIQIARRTVARYRKSLKIPSCQKRRGYHLNTLYF